MKQQRDKKYEKIAFPRWVSLPEIDLYMDQLIGFFEKKLAFLFSEDEKGVTSTMINNYVKHKVIMPPVKKKYSREHIAYLFVVITLKKAFSMSEIKAFIEKMSKKKKELLFLRIHFCVIYYWLSSIRHQCLTKSCYVNLCCGYIVCPYRYSNNCIFNLY